MIPAGLYIHIMHIIIIIHADNWQDGMWHVWRLFGLGGR